MNRDEKKSIDIEHPKVTIITATYNVESVLPGLIECLRQQTDRDFEWIVIDGLSTDNTLSLLKGAGDVVTSWVSEDDFGIYHALNKGVEKASGDYYLVMGADDRLKSDAIENYQLAAAQSGADIITTPVIFGGEVVRWRNGPSWFYSQDAFISSHSVGSIFKKDLHEEFGYYSRKYPIAADQLFVKRACKGGATLYQDEFVAGEFGNGGVSSVDYVGTLTEVFRVQLETEPKLLLVLLYMLRLIKNFRKL